MTPKLKRKIIGLGLGGAGVGLVLGAASREMFDGNDDGLTKQEKQKKYSRYSLGGMLAGAVAGAGITAAHHYHMSQKMHKKMHDGKTINQAAIDYEKNHPQREDYARIGELKDLRDRYKREWESDLDVYRHDLMQLKDHRDLRTRYGTLRRPQQLPPQRNNPPAPPREAAPAPRREERSLRDTNIESHIRELDLD